MERFLVSVLDCYCNRPWSPPFSSVLPCLSALHILSYFAGSCERSIRGFFLFLPFRTLKAPRSDLFITILAPRRSPSFFWLRCLLSPYLVTEFARFSPPSLSIRSGFYTEDYAFASIARFFYLPRGGSAIDLLSFPLLSPLFQAFRPGSRPAPLRALTFTGTRCSFDYRVNALSSFLDVPLPSSSLAPARANIYPRLCTTFA